MITAAIAAASAICILVPLPSTGLNKWSSQGGSLCEPTTLSRTIFNGQGPATLIAVWTIMANRMTSRVPTIGPNKITDQTNQVESPRFVLTIRPVNRYTDETEQLGRLFLAALKIARGVSDP